MEQNLVSIIIPNFNQEVFLKDTLDSVLQQSFQHWECLIIDDGSSDNSITIIECYCEKDSRFRFVKRTDFPNVRKGGSACRNIGIQLAKGEYIIFLDSDDILFKFCLETRLSYYKKNPDCDFLVFQMMRMNEEGPIPNSELTKRSENYLYDYLSYHIPWTITSPIIKTEFVKNHLVGFDEDFPRLQDPEFFTRALLVKNVNFKVFEYLPADCLYRTFASKKFNYVNALNGFSLFIDKFYGKIKLLADVAEASDQLSVLFSSIFNQYLARLTGDSKITICTALFKFNSTAYRIGLIPASFFLRNNFRILLQLFKNAIISFLIKVKLYSH